MAPRSSQPGSPPGFAAWWVDAYGQEEFADEQQREMFAAAVVAWDAALAFAEGRDDLAVLPNAYKPDLPLGSTLAAWVDPDPKDENARKLNRIITENGRTQAVRQEQPRAEEPTPEPTKEQEQAQEGHEEPPDADERGDVGEVQQPRRGHAERPAEWDLRSDR